MSKHIRHKYFRNKKYKQRCESKYDCGSNNGYPVHYAFLTKEPDLKNKRESNFFRWIEDTKCRGRSYYIYYNRPEVKYTILRLDYGNGVKKFFKRYANHVVRRNQNQLYNRALYKRVFDLCWAID